jgi:hypothetical protein
VRVVRAAAAELEQPGATPMSTRLLPLLLGLAASAAAADSWQAERITSAAGQPPRVERVWSKGPALRAEIVLGGHTFITYVKGDRYVVVDALTGKGTSIPRSPKAIAADASRGRPFGNEQQLLVAAGAEKVNTEGSGEGSCDLYRITDQAGRREVCVTTGKDALPVYVKAWDRQSGAESETRYLAWSKDLEGKDVAIADSFFSPDPRVTLESVSLDAFLAKAQEGKNAAVGPILYPELLVGR